MSRGFRTMMGVAVGLAGTALPARVVLACVTNADCNDNKPCTFDLCVFGNCTNTPDNNLCQDGSGCNGDEVCVPATGQCTPGTPIDCGPGNICVEIPTNPFYRCAECVVNADCDDGVFCNGPEKCVAGGCQPGVQPSCNPPDPCINGFCNLQTDQCESLPMCFDGDLCTNDTCPSGTSCVNPPNFNTATHCCNPATGQLTIISDGNSCTTDTCNTATGQVSHLGQPCDDGNSCTINDHFDCAQGGACVGTNVNTLSCTKDSDCAIGFCKSTTGLCSCTTCTTNPQCNDSRACTTDICDSVKHVCTYTTSDAACATGQYCNQQICNRDVGCVGKSFCTPTNGNPCPTSATCSNATSSCGTCQPPTVAIGGSRYFLVTANAANATSHALAIKGDCATANVACLSRYIDFDNPVNPNDPKAARLVASAVSKTAGTWGTVKLRATELRPGVKYYIYTECNPGGGGATRSSGVEVTLWRAGDTDGSGVTNFTDVSRLVTAFQGNFNAGLTLENADLTGAVSGDCRPNRSISFLDVSAGVDGFKGKAFPCAPPCFEP